VCLIDLGLNVIILIQAVVKEAGAHQSSINQLINLNFFTVA